MLAPAMPASDCMQKRLCFQAPGWPPVRMAYGWLAPERPCFLRPAVSAPPAHPLTPPPPQLHCSVYMTYGHCAALHATSRSRGFTNACAHIYAHAAGLDVSLPCKEAERLRFGGERSREMCARARHTPYPQIIAAAPSLLAGQALRASVGLRAWLLEDCVLRHAMLAHCSMCACAGRVSQLNVELPKLPWARTQT